MHNRSAARDGDPAEAGRVGNRSLRVRHHRTVGAARGTQAAGRQATRVFYTLDKDELVVRVITVAHHSTAYQ